MGGPFLVVLVLSVLVAVSGQEAPEVTAPVGKVKGSIIQSRLGKNIFSFRGVRYGEPPVGQRRFEVPVPIADWDDVFDASQEGPSCPRIGDNREQMSEDCLRLNVYTTKLPTKNENPSRPVMVFFHPGAFYSFTALSSFFGPQYIMDKDIVLVTVSYRLGSLGFFSTGESLAPGNAGMKDQVIALRWVQRNIAAFGGNPNSVTIAGYSAGSYSVLLHMVSPMSRGLFHKAIAMSAGITSTMEIPHNQTELAKKQARLLDCPTDTTGAMLVCLKSKPVDRFLDTMTNFFEWYGDPILVWMPVIEPEVRGVERFLPEDPFDLIRKGKIHEVPLIAGLTKDEFAGVLVAVEAAERRGERIYDQMNSNWTTIAPISFIYERDTPRSLQISRELRRFYFNDQPISRNNSQGLANVYADTVTIFPMHRSAQLYATYSREPVYFYEFTFPGRFSFNTWPDGTPYGVSHHDDLQYLFFMQVLFPYFNATDPEIPMLERYTSMWTSFMETGEPIPKDDPRFAGVNWERFEPRKDNYLEINLNPRMKTGYHTERMRLMDRLFPMKPLRSGTKNTKH